MRSYFSFINIFVCLVIAGYFFFGLNHISQFVTADEHYWVYERIPQYWDALENEKYRKTLINDKPGISLALFSGIGYFLRPDSKDFCAEDKEKFEVCKSEDADDLYALYRLPILIINGLLLLLFGFLISKLTNRWIGLWSMILVGFSPLLIGASQIINPDSLLWSFGSIAFFSFIAYLKTKEKKYVALCAVFTGFSLLSKYAAIILLPFYGLAALGHFFLSKDSWKRDREIRRNFLIIGSIALSAILLLVLFLPAILVYPKALLTIFESVPKKIPLILTGSIPLAFLLIDIFFLQCVYLNKARFFIKKFSRMIFVGIHLFFFVLFSAVIGTRYFFPAWDIFTTIPFDIKNITNARYYAEQPHLFEIFLLEWNPLIFSLTPIALLGLFFLWILSIRKKREYFYLSVALPLFGLLYILILMQTNVLAIPRYLLFVFPFFLTASALGFWYLQEALRIRSARYIITIVLILSSCASIFTIKPFYFNYSNFLLPQGALISDSWGYGGYEAAQYLNSLPEAKNLTIWSDYYGVCEFTLGKCITAYNFDKETIKPDYYALTRRGGIRYRSRYRTWENNSGLKAYLYYTETPAWELLIDDRPENFVKIFKVSY